MTSIHKLLFALLTSIVIVASAGYASTPQTRYEGQRNYANQPHGYGTLIESNGNNYTGEWKDGKRNGRGKQVYAGFGVYVGEWKDDMQHGQGKATYPNGATYEGEWKSHMQHGQGKLTIPNQGTVDGEFKDDKAHGIGIFTRKDGHKWFEGVYKNGVPYEGTFFPVDGSPISGQIKDLRRVSDGVVEFSVGGVKYIDEFIVGKFYRADGIPLLNDSQISVDQEVTPVDSNKKKVQVRPTGEAVQSPSDKKERLALLIGNASYQSSPLANPVNDVRGMAFALRKAGFTVIKHENLNFRQMREAVRDFGEKLSKDHVGLFYYSGHGVQVDGKNYLIPVNSDIKYEDEVASSALDAEMVLAKLESAKNKLNIVVLDACRDSPLGRRTRTSTKGLSNMNAASGTMIAFSTAPGQVALDGKGSNSPYTKHLINAIQKEGLLLEQVFKEVRGNVMKDTNGTQVPWENSSILGDFYFIPKERD